MNIGEIIKNKKVSIFFEDTGMKNNARGERTFNVE